MSNAQNLAYAVVQVAHNFGAVAAVGGSLAAIRLRNPATRKKLARLALGGWITQGVSGAAFGATSYYFYQRLPDIAGIAVDALLVKMACVAIAIALLTIYIWRGGSWSEAADQNTWFASSALAVTALSAAAFLRWFS
jgi:hypothetical protein